MAEKIIKGNSSVMACEMKKLLNNPLMSDVQFEIGPERKVFYGHKCILATRCEIFKSMFVDQTSKKETPTALVLQEMKPDIFKYLLEFLYTNWIQLEKSSVNESIELLAIAMEFGLEDLRKILQTFLIHFLHKDNVCKICQTANNLGLIQLKENCLKFLYAAIQNITDFSDLSPDLMEEIFSSDELEINELKLVEILRNWSKVYSQKTDEPQHRFCKSISRHLRLGLLTPEQIAELEDENSKDNIISAETFALAWKTHALGPSGAGSIIVPRGRGNLKKSALTNSGTSSQSVFD